MITYSRLRRAGIALIGLVLVSCSSENSGSDPAASLDLAFVLEMPHFVGLGAPITYIDFYWTIVVHGPTGTLVKAVRSQVREPASTTMLETEDVSAGVPPFGFPFQTPTAQPPVYVPESSTVALNQEVRGAFASDLYPGAWRGETIVEVVYPSGRSEQLHVSFAF